MINFCPISKALLFDFLRKGKKAAETSEKAKNASMKARAAFDFSKEIKVF